MARKTVNRFPCQYVVANDDERASTTTYTLLNTRGLNGNIISPDQALTLFYIPSTPRPMRSATGRNWAMLAAGHVSRA